MFWKVTRFFGDITRDKAFPTAVFRALSDRLPGKTWWGVLLRFNRMEAPVQRLRGLAPKEACAKSPTICWRFNPRSSSALVRQSPSPVFMIVRGARGVANLVVPEISVC